MDDQNWLSEEQRERIRAREISHSHMLEADKRHEQLFAPFGVNFPVYRTMVYLTLNEEGAAPSEVADELMILRQSMTSILDGLEKKGLLQRLADPTDRRRLRVKLLPPGQELAKQLILTEQAYGERIQSYMGDADLEEYHRLEQRMYEAKVAALNDVLTERTVE